MALRGNLRDFTFTQLLNLVNLAQKTGTLVVESPGETAQVYFREGKLAYAQLGANSNGLASILNQAKKITPNQYRIIQQHASQISDKELGLMLISSGSLTKSEILQSIQQYCIDIIQRMFTWAEGMFRFESGLQPPDNRIQVHIDLENLIIEGSRNLREWEQLQDEIPSLDMALKFTDRPGSNLKKVNLNVEEWRVVSYVNPHNSMRQIANAIKVDDTGIRRIVLGLVQAGLVEIVRPTGMLPPGSIKPFLADNREEKTSLVNRLINRIRSI